MEVGDFAEDSKLELLLRTFLIVGKTYSDISRSR